MEENESFGFFPLPPGHFTSLLLTTLSPPSPSPSPSSLSSSSLSPPSFGDVCEIECLREPSFAPPLTYQFSFGEGEASERVEQAMVPLLVGQAETITLSDRFKLFVQFFNILHDKQFENEKMTIKLTKIESPKEASFRTQLAGSTQQKGKGNQLVAKKDWGAASSIYEGGFPHFDGLFAPCLGVFQEANTLKWALLLNQSLCELKQKNASKALELSEKVLQEYPKHSKGLYRAGMASLSLNRLLKAREYLEEALLLNPENVEIQNALQEIHNRLKGNLKVEKDLYAAMFSPSEK